MSQIAATLQLSKKTLYAEFDTKEDLLQECLIYEKERVTKIIKKAEGEAENMLEALILIVVDLYHYCSAFCPSFFKDVQQYIEAQRMVLAGKSELHDLYMKFFKQGIDEEYFQAGIDYEVVSLLFVEQMGDWDNMRQPHIILSFLQGVCTAKGIEILNRFTPLKLKL